MDYISNEALIHLTQLIYPEIVAGRDYTVVCKCDMETNRPIEHARYETWSYSKKQPTSKKLQAMYSPDAVKRWSLEHEVRTQRNNQLRAADAMLATAQDNSDAVREAAVRKYRRALRDITEQPNFPFEIDWPQIPDT